MHYGLHNAHRTIFYANTFIIHGPYVGEWPLGLCIPGCSTLGLPLSGNALKS